MRLDARALAWAGAFGGAFLVTFDPERDAFACFGEVLFLLALFLTLFLAAEAAFFFALFLTLFLAAEVAFFFALFLVLFFATGFDAARVDFRPAEVLRGDRFCVARVARAMRQRTGAAQKPQSTSERPLRGVP